MRSLFCSQARTLFIEKRCLYLLTEGRLGALRLTASLRRPKALARFLLGYRWPKLYSYITAYKRSTFASLLRLMQYQEYLEPSKILQMSLWSGTFRTFRKCRVPRFLMQTERKERDSTEGDTRRISRSRTGCTRRWTSRSTVSRMGEYNLYNRP